VLGAPVRTETTQRRAAIGPQRHRLRGMIPRRLRALSWGPAGLRPSAGHLVARAASAAPRSSFAARCPAQRRRRQQSL